ncbi:G-protein coupled receptor Mth2-like isoform X2 [Anopheles albimanus]|uniref:G-protein coupled receptor Mth2-like isoform X2 n=1 Tax=Anopheles albimanus TaxID=7167 RepID=UPI00163FAC70|nr:G-protein coupled receptor Mth2-like isoform X2 [Anopheles albimanus]
MLSSRSKAYFGHDTMQTSVHSCDFGEHSFVAIEWIDQGIFFAAVISLQFAVDVARRRTSFKMLLTLQSNAGCWKWLVLLLSYSVQAFDQNLCSDQESVDITNGEMSEIGIVEYQGVLYNSSQYFEVGNVRRGCICLVRQCIYVCQSKNLTRDDITELYANVSDASGNSLHVVNLAENAQYHLILQEPYCAGNPLELEQEQVHIKSNGELKLNEFEFNYPLFCMLPKNEMDEFRAAYCEHETSDLSHLIYALCFLVSLPFLVVTFMVYAILPEMQNLPGLSVMCYVASLSVSYLLLALGRMDIYDYRSVMCRISAYTLYFTLMASFFWLNIMSFDICWTFAGRRGRTSERRKFLYYSVYAWGTPLLCVSLVLLLDHTEFIRYNLRPNIGKEGCFLKEEMLTQFLYLYLPLLLLVAANIYFFAITAIRIYQAEKTNVLMMNGNSRRHTKYEKDRNRFRLYLRLFTIMGVTWSLEIISWLVTQSKTSPSWLAYVLDVSNCLAGIVIFFLFVWKQRVRKLLVQRFNWAIGSSEADNKSNNTGSIQSTYLTHSKGMSSRDQSLKRT